MYLNPTLWVRLFRAYCLRGLKCTYGQSCDDGTTTTQDVQNYPGGWSFVVGGWGGVCFTQASKKRYILEKLLRQPNLDALLIFPDLYKYT